jgi:hypothetical protein
MYNIIDKIKLYKPDKKHVIALSVVSIIVILIVFMVPAQALIIDSSVKTTGILKEVTISLNPNSNDRLPVKEIKLTRNGYNESCYFDVSGNILTLSSCKAMDIVRIEKANVTINETKCKIKEKTKEKVRGIEKKFSRYNDTNKNESLDQDNYNIDPDCRPSYGYGYNNRLTYNVYIVASSVHAKDMLEFELRLGNSNNPFSKKIVIG